MPTSVTTPDDLTPLLDRLTALEQTAAAHAAAITDLRAFTTALDADVDQQDEALETPVVTPPPQPAVDIVLWYARRADYAALQAKGFTGVHEWADTSGGRKAQIDEARALGLDFWLELSWAMEGGVFRPERLANMLAQYRGYPGVKGVVSYDEPDLHTPRYDPNECRKMYEAVKAAWPGIPQKVTIRYPFRASGAPYIPYCDILSIDPYIILKTGGGPPEQAGQETAQTVAVAGGKPVATDIQAFNWRDTFGAGTGRYPTVAEIQTMATTSAKAQGTTRRHIWYWDAPALASSEGAAAWAALGTINAAVRAAI